MSAVTGSPSPAPCRSGAEPGGAGPLLGPALAARRQPPPAHLPNTARVLSLGLDEYLALVYSQLAGPAGVSRADVRRLCALLAGALGRPPQPAVFPADDDTDGRTDGADGGRVGGDGDQPALDLERFQQAVCAHFGVAARPAASAPLVDVEVTVERRAAVIDQLDRSIAGARSPSAATKRRRGVRLPRAGRTGRGGGAGDASDEPPVSLLLLERELTALRELVEDLRRSLVESDARNIGLEVRARRTPERTMGGAAEPSDAQPAEDSRDGGEHGSGDGSGDASRDGSGDASRDGSGENSDSDPASDPSVGSESSEPPAAKPPALPPRPKSCCALLSTSSTPANRAAPPVPRSILVVPRSARDKDIEAETNRSISESQRNFDALIRELRAISEPRAPYHPELSLEDELEQTYEALQMTQTDLERSRATIHGTRTHLRGKDREVRLAKQDLIAAEAAVARLQEQVKQLQSDLQASQHQHEMERLAHERTSHQLGYTRAQLAESQTALEQSRSALRDLQQLRRRVLAELTQTRHLLVTALCRVRQLEAASEQVPVLEARVHQLESLLKRRSSSQGRPASHVDSGLYSTSESDHEDTSHAQHNRSTDTTSEEHDALIRLEEQVHWLRQQFLEAEREWEQERRQLVEEVTQRQEDCQLMAGDIQHLEQEQQPLLLLHERASSVVDVLQNLRHVNISPRALGRLVYDALERTQECSSGGGNQRAFRFLTCLHRSASGYERLSTESLIQLALEGLGRAEEVADHV
ncbi:EF-hand and coiled-coil domain-containing protein 1 [Amphibalanus amphitrite]|uniref:EF-hand and coiled-coil domain-containing protein 1 n=1 Tax=Amphibalanus amphitrite TaxID=1232801 RepID=A0A6A4VS34_AMPAM|nr:EF-hand and coiled-coil domain-containing protein 1 [Amphibalanus amphitrite]KAF0294230.1 EF-hand and coiled-coil domain-containing protein 1 [Amphibalanus amphitrite]